MLSMWVAPVKKAAFWPMATMSSRFSAGVAKRISGTVVGCTRMPGAFLRRISKSVLSAGRKLSQ